MKKALLVAMVALAGCGSPSDVIIEQLEERHRAWARLGIDDYSFTFQQSCFCPPDAIQPVRITVINNQITSVRSVSSNAPLANLDWFYTIEALFNRLETHARIQRAILSVQFDPERHFPTRAEGDIQQTADAGFLITISNFSLATN